MAARHHAPGADVELAEQINRRRRKDVFRRYALLRNGKPVFCRAAGGKIVYPSMEAAIAAGAELTRIDTGHPMNAYECPRGEHYHLHTDAPRARRMRCG